MPATHMLADAERIIDTLLAALEDCATRMERARGWLTDDNPRPDCNWGVLDTKETRKVIAQAKEV